MPDMKDAVARAKRMEVYIERWSNGDVVHYPWSIWVDGKQLVSSHGHAEYDSAEQARHDAMRICGALDRQPDRINQL